MCAQGLFYKLNLGMEEEKKEVEVQSQDEMLMVPLKDVEIMATLEGAHAIVNFNMTYTNPNENAIECTYEFPLESNTLLSKLVISLEDFVVEAVVKEKSEAN